MNDLPTKKEAEARLGRCFMCKHNEYVEWCECDCHTLQAKAVLYPPNTDAKLEEEK